MTARTPRDDRAGSDARRSRPHPAPSSAADEEGAPEAAAPARRSGPCVAPSPAPETELVILVGLPGSGKTTFAGRLARTHRRVSQDALRAAGRPTTDQRALVEAALAAGQSVVVDNVHATPAARAPWVELARRLGVRAVACYLDVPKAVCLARNRARTGPARVPDVAIHVAAARLVPPSPDEGFDEVRTVAPG